MQDTQARLDHSILPNHPIGSNLTAWLTAYESGELDDDDVMRLYQHLLTSNIIYDLQQMYQRVADALLTAGMIHRPQFQQS